MAHGHNNPAHFGIRTKQYKLIFFCGVDYTDTHNRRKIESKDGNRFWRSTPAGWEFYDLSKDPHEMRNEYRNPNYQSTIARLKRQLANVRAEVEDTDEGNPRILEIIAQHWGD